MTLMGKEQNCRNLNRKGAELAGSVSPQRGIAHAETSADVFREQFDGPPIRNRVRLRKIFHCFYQQPLSVNVTGIGSAFTLLSAYFRNDRNRKDLGHATPGDSLLELDT
jgi:hypothetical protein